MSKTKTNNFLSEAEYKAMLDEIREQKRSAKKEMKRGCYNMAGMYYGDAAALCRVLGHINDGDFKRAAETAQGQDTAARDNVPSAIWDKLSKYMQFLRRDHLICITTVHGGNDRPSVEMFSFNFNSATKGYSHDAII